MAWIRLVAAAAGAVAVACSAGGRTAPSLSTVPVPAPTLTATTVAPASTTTRLAAVVAAAAGQPATPLCAAVPARVAPRSDRPSYALRIDVRPSDSVVDGHLTVRFTPDVGTDHLEFRLWPNGPVLAAAGARLDVGVVSVGAQPPAAQSQPDPTTLIVGLRRPLAAGQTVEAELPWRLTLPGTTNDRISRTGDTLRLGSFFPILAWEPGVGWATEPPTVLHGETATSPPADFVASITVPDGLTVLATGVPDGGRRVWKADAVPDFAVSVGHFTVVSAVAYAPQPVAVTVGVAAGLADPPAAYLDKTRRVLAAYGRRFGPYGWDAYTLAITPGLTGGIEYPMHTMQGPGSLGGTTSHELGHQWFYALVTDDQARDPFLDEALATWAEAGFEGSLSTIRSRPMAPSARGQVGRPMTFWAGQPANYYAGVYLQGVQALAALGPPDAIDCALRRYVARHAFTLARPADLVSDLSAVFPNAGPVLARYGING